MTRAFASVVLDVDSTVSGIEGIDWLAERRGPAVAAEIARLTDEAMRGIIPLESVYGARLSAIQPTRDDVDELSREYIARIAEGSAAAIAKLQDAGVRVVLVSGGLRQAIQPLSAHVGVGELEAVDIHFDADGAYASFDESSTLTTSIGKAAVVTGLQLPRPILAVGDGSTDLAMKPVVDRFAAFTGFVARPGVVAGADLTLSSFDQLLSLVLP
jgi:phosphoserine phosphatase